MPRITVADGPSNAGALPGEVGYIEPDAEGLLGAGYGGPVGGLPFAADDVAASALEAPAVSVATQGAGPDDIPPTDGPPPDYASMTVLQLRDAARVARLPVGGSKAQLVERLEAFQNTVGAN